MAEVFQHLSAESAKMEPVLRSDQVLKQEAEEIGLQGKDIAEYARQQTLDREERAAWRDTQKMQAQANLELARSEDKQKKQRKRGQMRSRCAEIQAEE